MKTCISLSTLCYWSVSELSADIAAVAVKAALSQQSWDVAFGLISVNAMILPWILSSCMEKKRKQKNPFSCKGKGPGAQSVSLSVETTVQYMNNTLWPQCENSFFLSAYTSSITNKPTYRYIFFKASADITVKSNSTESTGHFRRVKTLNYNRGPRPHKSNQPNYPIWSPATPYVPLFLWRFPPIPLSPVWLSCSTLSSCKYAAGTAGRAALTEANQSPLNMQSFFQSTTGPRCYMLPALIWTSLTSTKNRLFIQKNHFEM